MHCPEPERDSKFALCCDLFEVHLLANSAVSHFFHVYADSESLLLQRAGNWVAYSVVEYLMNASYEVVGYPPFMTKAEAALQ